MDSNIDVIVVDDEQLGRQNLKALLEHKMRWTVIAEAADGETAIKKIVELRPAVIFLDIEMPKMNGMQVARELLEKYSLPLIVFVTAYSRYAVEAFEVNAVDYLLKPIRGDRFNSAVKRVEETIDHAQIESFQDRVATVLGHFRADGTEIGPWLKQIAVRSVGRVQFVDVGELVWIGASGNYVELHLDSRTVLHRQTLTSLAKQVDPESFLQVHRSALVNVQHITEFLTTSTGSAVRMVDGAEVAVSGRYRSAVKSRLSLT